MWELNMFVYGIAVLGGKQGFQETATSTFYNMKILLREKMVKRPINNFNWQRNIVLDKLHKMLPFHWAFACIHQIGFHSWVAAVREELFSIFNTFFDRPRVNTKSNISVQLVAQQCCVAS